MTYPRHLAGPLREALADTPVVFLNGARQTGKTTLAKMLAGGAPGRYLTLDDGHTLAAAADPAGFIAGLSAEPGTVVLDEVQLAPKLLPAIKAAVDRDRRPGRFLLTGSADVLLLPGVSESLAGRMEILTLQPLSQGEIAGRRETLVDALFAGSFRPGTRSGGHAGGKPPRRAGGAPDRAELAERVTRGGYPEAVARARETRRAAWFDAYVRAIIQRDIRALSGIEGLALLPRLLALLAVRAGGLLNLAELSRALGIPHTTLQRYLALLELTFIFQPLSAWSANPGKRLVKAPKIHLSDTGLAARLAGVSTRLMLSDPARAGGLLEGFVLGELRKQAAWSKTLPRFHHFRTAAGREVDIVLEDHAGRVVGVEVKAAATLQPRDFDGLKALAQAAGKHWLRGIILHAGTEPLPFAADLHALPINALWDF
jgi:hypothetical protein